jgi:hypothetical protein
MEWLRRSASRREGIFPGAEHEQDPCRAADLRDDWTRWQESAAVEVYRPARAWEGAREPVKPSLRSSVDHPVNQLRDPFVFVDEGAAHLVYAVAGEAGLGIARLDVPG